VPYFAYAHSATVVPGETCPTGSSANGTGTVMKAACGAVLGSGTTLIQ